MTGLVDFATLTRPSSPNTALLAPEGVAPNTTPDGAAPVYDAAPDALYNRVLRMIAGRKDWRLGEQDPAGLRVSFVAVTKLLRFKDDVDVMILPVPGEPGKSTFAAYSRSRVGYSDLGTNLKRLNAFADAMKAP